MGARVTKAGSCGIGYYNHVFTGSRWSLKLRILGKKTRSIYSSKQDRTGDVEVLLSRHADCNFRRNAVLSLRKNQRAKYSLSVIPAIYLLKGHLCRRGTSVIKRIRH